MKTYEVLFVTPHGNGWAIVNSDTVDSVRSILENQSKFQPLNILHIKERKVICGLNTSIIYEGHCETLMSPYDLAVSQGYEGSLEEWLESLKGESAYEIWLDQGHTGTEEDFLDWLRELSSTSLQELNDVNVDSPSDNQALIYNNTTQKWENKNIPEGSLIVSFTEDSNSIICNVPIDTIVQASHNGKNIVGRYAMNYQQYLYYIYGNVENFVDGYIRFTFNVSQDSKSVIIEGYKSGYNDRWHKYSDFYYFTQDYKNKLEGIESGAQVNIQSDWDESDSSSDAFIRNRPTIPTVNNATLTIQKNSTIVDTFTANASVDKTINITVPTTAADVNALPSSTKYGASLLLSINSSTYVVTAQLKDQNGSNLGTAQTVDLPLESVVVNGSYDSATKKVILTLQNGSTIEFSVADLINGLQSEITAQNPLSADLVTDGNTNKVYTATEKTKLAGIQAGAEVNVQSDWNQSNSSADDYIKNKPDVPYIIYIYYDGDGYVDSYGCSATEEELHNNLAYKTGKPLFYKKGSPDGDEVYEPMYVTSYECNVNQDKSGSAGDIELYWQYRLSKYKYLISWYYNFPDETDRIEVSRIDIINIQPDWNESDNTKEYYIKNKPSLASVATSGNYNDLNNKPTIPSAINDLSDVDIASAANQNVLMYDSTSSKWKNATIPSGVTSLSALSDVDLTSLANGQMLQYNSTSQKWENVDIPSDAFICTFTQTTDPQTEESVISCDKTISEIIAAANEGKTVIAKISESSEETETTVFIPLNLIYNGIVIFGGLMATPFENVLTILYGIHDTSTDMDRWSNEMNSFASVAFSGDYNALSNLPTLGTAAALDVAASGNASSSQVVKGDDTRLTAEVFVCTWNGNSMNKTLQEIYNAYTSGKVIICKYNEATYYLVDCYYTTDNNCIIRFICVTNIYSQYTEYCYLTCFNGTWSHKSNNLQHQLIGSGTGQNLKTVNGNNLLGSGDVHISGDIMFLTATAGSNNTYRLPKTVQELVDLYDNGITVVVNVSNLLYYRISRSSPLFINITNDYIIGILYTVGAGSDASDTVWRINTRTIQEKLVSGTNIKTINNESILGSGDISITASGINAIPSSEKGANGGVAELDSNGKVPSSQLPSYVDDVVEYASMSNFPVTGESGKIYIALDTNKTYRWSGSAYVEISESLALGETSSTAYAGNKGKANADAITAIKDGNSIDSFGDVETALADKINKVTNSTNGNFAALNSNGNIIDSGHKHSDYLTSQQNADWNATSGAAKILNKPTIPDAVSGTNDGTNWTSLTIGSTTKNIPSGGSSTLSGLTDTNISNPSAGQTLKYNNSSSKWENSDFPTEMPPQTGNSGKFLTTNGSAVSWANLPSDVVYCTWNGSTCSMTVKEIYEAYSAGKTVICKASISDYYSSTVLCTMTRIDWYDETSPGMGDDSGFVEFIGKYLKTTIDNAEDNIYRITAIKEVTLGYTSWTWVGGDYINLENLQDAISKRHLHSNKTQLDKIPSSLGTAGQILTVGSNSTITWANAPTELPTITGNANKILAVNSGATGVEWITNSGGGGLTNYDFTHTANQSVSGSVTVTYAANTRGSKMVSASADLSVTFAVNNNSDNYLWIKNNGSSDIDILISSVTYNSSSVSNVYMPADGITIPAGKVCEIGIVRNADGAFITSRNDLEL